MSELNPLKTRKTQEESREFFRDLADSMIRVAEHVKNVSNTRSKELKSAMKMFLEVTEETMGLMESLANESTTAKISALAFPGCICQN